MKAACSSAPEPRNAQGSLAQIALRLALRLRAHGFGTDRMADAGAMLSVAAFRTSQRWSVSRACPGVRLAEGREAADTGSIAGCND